MPDRDFTGFEGRLAEKPASNTQGILLAVIQAIGTGNFAALPQYLTDDVELHIHGFPALDGRWLGCTAVVAATASNYAKVTDQKPQIRAMIAQGDEIALRFHETGRLVESNDSYEVDVVLWCTFVDGRIRRIEEFIISH